MLGLMLRDAPKRSRRRRTALVVLASLATEILALRLRGYRLGGNVVVRCRRGHLFTTIWVPGASVKSLRLGPWRVQRCPVGSHWTLVWPVDRSTLSRSRARRAGAARDLRLP